MKGTSMIRSCYCRCRTRYSGYSGHSGSRMQDSRLRRPMNDDPLLVQCI